ncbi:uncharacterized protein VTP21DRAFT_3901 [Calcarisporiella thermophila]|uniref:uncharacterized protein n=1 Tax=Calcarisporiella thermophila TaxID=911321 RepID=UPI0037425AD9
MDIQNSNVIFTKSIDIFLSPSGAPDFDRTPLHRPLQRVTFEASKNHTPRGTLLELKLFDEDDPFFMYQVELSEESFRSLKREQHLVADFQHFPHELADLLDECVRNEHADPPRFSIQMCSDGLSPHSTLSITEFNRFKHITHLTLGMTRPEHRIIKQNYMRTLNALRVEIQTLRSQVDSSTSGYRARLNAVEGLNSTLSTEIERVKRVANEEQAQLKLKFEAERRDMVDHYEQQVKKLSELNEDLRKERDLLWTKVSTVDQAQQQRIVDQTRGLEEQLLQAKSEVQKGNEIIRKLQEELRSTHSKMKMKNKVTLQQEKLLDEKTELIVQLQQEVALLRENLGREREGRSGGGRRVEDLERQLEEKRKIMDDNARVIEWLHKQLNEATATNPKLPALESALKRSTLGPLTNLPSATTRSAAPRRVVSQPLSIPTTNNNNASLYPEASPPKPFALPVLRDVGRLGSGQPGLSRGK